MAAEPNWSPVEDLSFAQPNSEQIALAAGDSVVHLVWTQARGLYHARRTNSAWSAPARIAGGEQPALAVNGEGVLYCAFANWFRGNREIYAASFANNKWTLPELVSHTSGASSDPAICIGADGLPRIAWADTTPGYSIIYYASLDNGAWVNGPVPNGKGSRPTIAASGAAVYVAWQDRLASSPSRAFDVLAAERKNGQWGLPALVSDTRDLHSLQPRIAASAQGRCHLVWQEQRDDVYVIRHADLWPEGWAEPVDVSDPATDARLAFVMPNRWGQFQYVWSEGSALKHRLRPGDPQAQLRGVEVGCGECAGLSELAAALAPGGELHAVFTRYVNGSPRRLQYVRRKAIERQKIFLPIVN